MKRILLIDDHLAIQLGLRDLLLGEFTDLEVENAGSEESALKALDVKWMRLRLRGKGWCALVLVALLIHGDFVGSKLPEFVVLESSITLIAAMTLLNRRYLKSIQKLLTAWVLELSQAFNSWLEEVFVAQVLPHGFALSVPRGPPSR